MPDKQNEPVIGRDNPIVVRSVWTGTVGIDVTSWSEFTDIVVKVGTETYTLLLNPANVLIKSDQLLHIVIGPDTLLAPKRYQLVVTGYSATYPNGCEVVSKERTPEIEPVNIVAAG